MKIFHGSCYGRYKPMMQNPKADKANDLWWETVSGAYGSEPTRVLRTVMVEFEDGAAEVADELGQWMLQNIPGVSAEPVPFTRVATDVPRGEWETVYPTAPRKPPMLVGQPLPPEIARRLERPGGEKIRGWRKG